MQYTTELCCVPAAMSLHIWAMMSFLARAATGRQSLHYAWCNTDIRHERCKNADGPLPIRPQHMIGWERDMTILKSVELYGDKKCAERKVGSRSLTNTCPKQSHVVNNAQLSKMCKQALHNFFCLHTSVPRQMTGIQTLVSSVHQNECCPTQTQHWLAARLNSSSPLTKANTVDTGTARF